jgi:hypothetical protein
MLERSWPPRKRSSRRGCRGRCLGYSDPSSVTLYEEQPDAATTTLKGGRVGIAVLSDGSDLLATSGYAWDPWQSVAWNERKKAGFDDLATTMQELSAP